MGQNQFMPSLFELLLILIKTKSIFGKRSRCFASINNYLNKHGWEKDQLWSLEIKNRKDDIFNKDKIYNIDEIKKYIAFNKKIISTQKNLCQNKGN